MGAALPELARFSKLKRKIGRQVARIVLYLSRFIIEQQKQFNWATLQTLRVLSEGLRSSASSFVEQGRQKDEIAETLSVLCETVGRVEQELQEQRTALRRLKQDLGRREERLHAVAHEQAAHQTALQQLDAALGQHEERFGNLNQVLSRVKNDVILQQRLFSSLLERVKGTSPAVRQETIAAGFLPSGFVEAKNQLNSACTAT